MAPNDTAARGCPFRAQRLPSRHVIDVPTTTRLLYEIGGPGRILEFCVAFYLLAFADTTLQAFMYENDGAVAHGERLSQWIVAQMQGTGGGGCQHAWAAAHHRARHCEKRPATVRGACFSVRDARAWMRLHFWAMRECGLDRNHAFWTWYVQFIHANIGLHNSYAPGYTHLDAVWSTDAANVAAYRAAKCTMTDLCPSLYC
ncbi:hypothetical protein SPRG_07110 [Saprolegnia parasitica CBS 223.65]|uniref:Uncharacterized protein n=1 Tax=Saprolegnia parasitica (strain CBS 223.65) TaxID=695850 RepID=A0A067CLY8_SAPPC|nr:hypothetical protein SPRG_07110 [Saprolegnia parasitica CBS 223.65]KDO27837.1 hypothetical protein SPRG_07110 [Saprolegnia parasitica CBS 223.65]|eukprot:XP_012201297.1 hypothetical protein SPRG_07110 [Saprolegnia parasitica CBS 223.65]